MTKNKRLITSIVLSIALVFTVTGAFCNATQTAYAATYAYKAYCNGGAGPGISVSSKKYTYNSGKLSSGYYDVKVTNKTNTTINCMVGVMKKSNQSYDTAARYFTLGAKKSKTVRLYIERVKRGEQLIMHGRGTYRKKGKSYMTDETYVYRTW